MNTAKLTYETDRPPLGAPCDCQGTLEIHGVTSETSLDCFWEAFRAFWDLPGSPFGLFTAHTNKHVIIRQVYQNNITPLLVMFNEPTSCVVYVDNEGEQFGCSSFRLPGGSPRLRSDGKGVAKACKKPVTILYKHCKSARWMQRGDSETPANDLKEPTGIAIYDNEPAASLPAI